MKAKCPICACEILESPVNCDRCGVDYHVDCWKYNEGCAIYGCLPGLPDKSSVLCHGVVTVPGKEVVSTFWLRNTAVFALALIPPSGFALYSQSWFRIFRLPNPTEISVFLFSMLLVTLISYLLEGSKGNSTDRFVVVRIIVSFIVLAGSAFLWFAFVGFSLLIGLRMFCLKRFKGIRTPKLCCKG